MTEIVRSMSFSKGACQKQKKKAPAASLKRSNNGLGLPIHIKKVPILLNISYHIILPIYMNLLYINYIGSILIARSDLKSAILVNKSTVMQPADT